MLAINVPRQKQGSNGYPFCTLQSKQPESGLRSGLRYGQGSVFGLRMIGLRSGLWNRLRSVGIRIRIRIKIRIRIESRVRYRYEWGNIVGAIVGGLEARYPHSPKHLVQRVIIHGSWSRLRVMTIAKI